MRHEVQSPVQKSLQSIQSVILGHPTVVELALAALFARGSVLIEDRPGLGKTTLAKTLSKVLGLTYSRIQCTNDLLPMDILGRIHFPVPSIPSAKEDPQWLEGPIFASIVLLDELNRAPSRTQSAFLQAMEEGEVSLEGMTRALPTPQMFIATQNPLDQVGTSGLPESELDRFTIQLSLGYPDSESEKKILRGIPQKQLQLLSQVLTKAELLEIQNKVEKVTVSETFLDLVVRFLNHTRVGGGFLSPRAGRDLVRVSQALAWMRQRDFVTPEDFKYCLHSVTVHRLKDVDGFIQSFALQA